MDWDVKSKQNKQPPQKIKKEKKPAVVSVGLSSQGNVLG